MAAPEQARPVVASSFFHRSATGIAVSVVVAVALALLIFRDVDGLLTRTVAGSLEAEADAIGQLAVSGGVGAVQSLLQSRQHATGGSVVALSDAAGRVKVGLLGAMPAEVIANPAGGMFRYTSSQPAVPPSDRRAVGILRTLPDGARLMVARDVEEQLRAITRIRLTLAVGLAVLALAGLGAGYSASRRVVERVERVNATARAIMAGDMRERIPIASAGDEIDELSRNLNDMLDRIEQLMAGLREISDNIAHDLKTPLNRLRNRAEAALRDAAECDELRDALARAIEEADDLIKVFNAMLLIARLEAGALEGQTDRFDCGALVRDVAELYEPVAEAAGLTFEVSIADGLMVEANRQLVGQAVANLLDNAI
ncbi:MAG: HAMP domain-containing protein, partial [Hyphomicrobiaceae bacterium]